MYFIGMLHICCDDGLYPRPEAQEQLTTMLRDQGHGNCFDLLEKVFFPCLQEYKLGEVNPLWVVQLIR